MKHLIKLCLALVLVSIAPSAHACEVWWITAGEVVCDGDDGVFLDPYAAPACVEVSNRLQCDLTSDPECAYSQADMFDACMAIAGVYPEAVRQ